MVLTDEDVGRNVRRLRMARGMTQSALGDRVYLSRSAISRLESGQRAVTVPELAAMAAALGVEVAYLAVPSGVRPGPTVATAPLRSVLPDEASRTRSARELVKLSDLTAALLRSISRWWPRKTAPTEKDGLLSEADQSWEWMVRARRANLERLDVARYSTAIPIPDRRHNVAFGDEPRPKTPYPISLI